MGDEGKACQEEANGSYHFAEECERTLLLPYLLFVVFFEVIFIFSLGLTHWVVKGFEGDFALGSLG